MPAPIVEYKIISSDDSNELTVKVNSLLKEGHELYGQPFGEKGTLFQAMVKRKPEGGHYADKPFMVD